MKIELFKCDKCGSEYRKGGGGTIMFLVGYSPDPASARSEADHKHSDLCTKCQNALLHNLIDKLEMQVRVDLAKTYNAT